MAPVFAWIDTASSWAAAVIATSCQPTFAVEWPTAPGNSIFVLGESGFLRDWNPVEALKLEPGAYPTWLDLALVQDGGVFDYSPAGEVSDSRIEIHRNFPTQELRFDRDIRVYLPRGYDEHADRSYAVLYMHDGQNIFYPGGPFGSWNAEITADEEIGRGRVRETIIVGIDNTPDRLQEYIPPEDGGWGDRYLGFVTDELKPFVDGT